MLDRMFGGSVEGLLMNLFKTRQVDPDTLAALSEKLAKEELRTRKQEKKND
jgi:hypothetical protein